MTWIKMLLLPYLNSVFSSADTEASQRYPKSLPVRHTEKATTQAKTVLQNWITLKHLIC